MRNTNRGYVRVSPNGVRNLYNIGRTVNNLLSRRNMAAKSKTRSRTSAKSMVSRRVASRSKLTGYRNYTKTTRRRKTKFKKRNGRHLYKKSKFNKKFMMKLNNSLQPLQFYKNLNYGVIKHETTADANTSNFKYSARRVFTCGTYYESADSTEFGVTEEDKYELWVDNSGTYQTDLALAYNKFFDEGDRGIQATNLGCHGQILELKDSILLRNNQNVLCHVTCTYFTPRRYISMDNYGKNGVDALNYLNQQTTEQNFFTARSDWRNNPLAVKFFKLSVVKFKLLPGEQKFVKFGLGNLPFYGSSKEFNDTLMTQKFTRFLEIKAYGDIIFNNDDKEDVSLGPVNLGYHRLMKMKGRRLPTARGYIAQDFSTTEKQTLTTPYVTPLGSNQKVPVDNNL